MPAKSPSFFCEKCSSKVKQNEKSCPHCGRYFASVKCPSCNYTGNSREFTKGCPNCGYAMETERNGSTIKKQGKTDSLPFWVYLVAFVLLIAVLFLYYFFY